MVCQLRYVCAELIFRQLQEQQLREHQMREAQLQDQQFREQQALLAAASHNQLPGHQGAGLSHSELERHMLYQRQQAAAQEQSQAGLYSQQVCENCCL